MADEPKFTIDDAIMSALTSLQVARGMRDAEAAGVDVDAVKRAEVLRDPSGAVVLDPREQRYVAAERLNERATAAVQPYNRPELYSQMKGRVKLEGEREAAYIVEFFTKYEAPKEASDNVKRVAKAAKTLQALQMSHARGDYTAVADIVDLGLKSPWDKLGYGAMRRDRGVQAYAGMLPDLIKAQALIVGDVLKEEASKAEVWRAIDEIVNSKKAYVDASLQLMRYAPKEEKKA